MLLFVILKNILLINQMKVHVTFNYEKTLFLVKTPRWATVWANISNAFMYSPLVGWRKEGASDQRPPSMLEPVLGGVHSPSVVAPPECWPAEGEAVSGRLWATTGWCPSKPACCVAAFNLPHLCNHRLVPIQAIAFLWQQ